MQPVGFHHLEGIYSPVDLRMRSAELHSQIARHLTPVPMCFTPGTVIATPRGEKRIETLSVGDRIITRDNGLQQIRWIGTNTIPWQRLEAEQHLRPILIRAGALGDDLPEQDMLVSPNHRVLAFCEQSVLEYQEPEVFVAAKHLVNHRGIKPVDTLGTTYINMMFDRHEAVLSNGIWSESFQLTDMSLETVGNAQRIELFEIFPELISLAKVDPMPAARKTISKRTVRLLAR